MAENNISNIMSVTMEKIRSLVDSETIIGNPITTNNITIIPVSKLSFGIASGGSDFANKPQGGNVFGGGGAGASVTPMGFLVVKGNEVKFLAAADTASPIEKAITSIPEVVDTLSNLFKKDKETTI